MHPYLLILIINMNLVCGFVPEINRNGFVSEPKAGIKYKTAIKMSKSIWTNEVLNKNLEKCKFLTVLGDMRLDLIFFLNFYIHSYHQFWLIQ